MKPTVAFSVALAAVTGAGCSYQVVSPPARMVSLESARTARPGETVAGVKGGMYAAVFDPGVAVGSAGVRHGVEDNVELNVEGTWARVVYDGYPEIDCNIYAGRVGFKSSNARGSAAVLGGVGGGFAPAAGSFVAADFGGVLSRPSCLAVPFIGASVFASLPFDTKQVDFRRDDGTIHASDTADTTYGLSLGAGLEISPRPRALPPRPDAHPPPAGPVHGVALPVGRPYYHDHDHDR